MTFSGDPYRILGLAPGAQLDDVKRAYRRLAKRYHPDAAGPEAVARFLAIQGAYEAIAGPRARKGSGPVTRRTSAADPDRARATRDAYARRAGGWPGSSRTSDAGPGGRTRAGGSNDEGADRDGRSGTSAGGATGRRRAAGPTGASGPAGASGPSASRRHDAPRSDQSAPRDESRRGERPPRRPSRRKATLSSTSYDDAAHEPRHPEWQGSSWYGTSSGTYWTINPREYADPRKHGPEYQARARRAAGPGHMASGAGEGATGLPHEAAAPGPQRRSGPTSKRVWPEPEGPPEPPLETGTRGATEEPAISEPVRPSRIPTAGSIGLASGVVAAIPAAVVVLGSTMSGDLSLAAVALAVPGVVAVGVGLAVGLLRRGEH